MRVCVPCSWLHLFRPVSNDVSFGACCHYLMCMLSVLNCIGLLVNSGIPWRLGLQGPQKHPEPRAAPILRETPSNPPPLQGYSQGHSCFGALMTCLIASVQYGYSPYKLKSMSQCTLCTSVCHSLCLSVCVCPWSVFAISVWLSLSLPLSANITIYVIYRNKVDVCWCLMVSFPPPPRQILVPIL